MATGSSDGTGGADQLYEADLTVLESPDHGPQLCAAVAESYPPQCGGPDVVGWDWEVVADSESASGTTWGTYHVVGTWDDGTFTLAEAATAPTGGGPQHDRDFSPACDEPQVDDPTHGAAEWEASSQDGPVDIPELIVVWVSDPAGDWDGPFVANVVVRPGAADEAEARVRQRYLGPLCVVERDAPTEEELRDVQREVDDASDRLGMVSSSADGIEGVVVVEVWVTDDETVAFARDRWDDLVRLEAILQPVS